nr:MAG TPA: hypothetical protein [Caudoviricetes sp.]
MGRTIDRRNQNVEIVELKNRAHPEARPIRPSQLSPSEEP